MMKRKLLMLAKTDKCVIEPRQVNTEQNGEVVEENGENNLTNFEDILSFKNTIVEFPKDIYINVDEKLPVTKENIKALQNVLIKDHKIPLDSEKNVKFIDLCDNFYFPYKTYFETPAFENQIMIQNETPKNPVCLNEVLNVCQHLKINPIGQYKDGKPFNIISFNIDPLFQIPLFNKVQDGTDTEGRPKYKHVLDKKITLHIVGKFIDHIGTSQGKIAEFIKDLDKEFLPLNQDTLKKYLSEKESEKIKKII